MKNKKAVSAIVSTILLILISFVAVMIVWNIMRGISKRTDSSTIDMASMFVGMQFEGSVYFESGACPGTSSYLTFSVTRGSDSANIEKLKITITGKDSAGNSVISYFNVTAPGPLGTKPYYLDICPIVSDVTITINPLEKTTGKPLEKVEYETDDSDIGTPSGGWPGTTEHSYESTCVETPEVLISNPCLEGSSTEIWEKTNTSCDKVTRTVPGAYCIPTGYVSWWKFDDGSGTTASDFAGTNPGTLYSSGELVTNGGAESWPSGWTASAGFSAVSTDTHSGAQRFNVADKSLTIMSNDLIEIDLSKDYNLSGWFRTFGTSDSNLHFGFAPYNKDKKPISNHNVNNVANTETTLYAAVNPTDTVVKIVDNGKCGNWIIPGCPTGCHGRIAFDVKDDFSDLPNYNVGATINSLAVDMGAWCEVTLTAGAGVSYPVGTKIREHQSGGSYMYSVVSGSTVTKASLWKSYSKTIEEESTYGTDYSKWWRGTKYVRILILAHNSQPAGTTPGQYILGFDDISLKTIPPTHTGATWTTDGSKNVLKFDGVDDWINIGDKDLSSMANSGTVTAWANLEQDKNWAGIVSDSEGGAVGKVWLDSYYTGSNKKLSFSIGNTATYNTVYSQAIALKNWYFVAGTWSYPGTICIYLNDQAPVCSTLNQPFNDGNKPLVIGKGFNSNNYLFNGSIDNVMIYNKALTADEIKGIYCSQSPSGTAGC